MDCTSGECCTSASVLVVVEAHCCGGGRGKLPTRPWHHAPTGTPRCHHAPARPTRRTRVHRRALPSRSGRSSLACTVSPVSGFCLIENALSGQGCTPTAYV